MPESNHIFFNGVKVFYQVFGSGKPIMLLHGFAETGKVWLNQIKYLKDNFKVIVPDLPGAGRSEELNIPAEETTINDYANVVIEIIRNEKIEDCTLIGHSMGGYITLAVVERQPEFLSGFGFVHSTAFADSEEKKQNRLKAIETMQQQGTYAFLKSTTPNLFAELYKNVHPDEIDQLIENGKLFSVKSLQQCYYAMMNRKDKTDVLRKTKLPVLFIAGDEDKAVPLPDVLKQVYLPEMSYIHILNHTGHMGMWEASAKVSEYLEGFVNETAR